jgi:hypothetical protein
MTRAPVQVVIRKRQRNPQNAKEKKAALQARGVSGRGQEQEVKESEMRPRVTILGGLSKRLIELRARGLEM